MSQYRSAYQTQPPRSTPLKALAANMAVAALIITGSAGVAVAATSPAAPAASGTHTCAIKTDGTLWCWGS